jgi:hypothetical protein
MLLLSLGDDLNIYDIVIFPPHPRNASRLSDVAD